MHQPIVLVEILSVSNDAETRTNIWAYTTIPGLRELLLLRSSGSKAELLRRDPEGNWPADPILLNASAALVLESIGFTAPLAALYSTTD